MIKKKVADSGNTRNLSKHLETTHPESHSELEKRQAAEKVQPPAPPVVGEGVQGVLLEGACWVVSFSVIVQ